DVQDGVVERDDDEADAEDQQRQPAPAVDQLGVAEGVAHPRETRRSSIGTQPARFSWSGGRSAIQPSTSGSVSESASDSGGRPMLTGRALGGATASRSRRRAAATSSVAGASPPSPRCAAAASSTAHTIGSQSASGSRVTVTKSLTPNT